MNEPCIADGSHRISNQSESNEMLLPAVRQKDYSGVIVLKIQKVRILQKFLFAISK
jgi:hypothetical protein